MTSPQFQPESVNADNNYGYDHHREQHQQYIPSNYRPHGSSASVGVRENSDQHDSEQKGHPSGPQMLSQSPY